LSTRRQGLIGANRNLFRRRKRGQTSRDITIQIRTARKRIACY
jgi:hypothetical protein